MQRLLVSIRGPKEALEASKGGAHIADVEYPASALGTPYPLNITAVRNRLNRYGFQKIAVSTNIGEKQFERTTACQAALGVATAGADIVKCGLAELPYEAAAYLGRSLVKTIKTFHRKKKIIPVVFIDDEMQRFFKPLSEGVKLVTEIKADGLLIDTFNKSIGKGLRDYCSVNAISHLVQECHKNKKEAWVAGSITQEEMSDLWATGVDVICVRGAACKQEGRGRFGTVKASIVSGLVSTMHIGKRL
jgi:uncharacterized protein (UPF0264 family)